MNPLSNTLHCVSLFPVLTWKPCSCHHHPIFMVFVVFFSRFDQQPSRETILLEVTTPVTRSEGSRENPFAFFITTSFIDSWRSSLKRHDWKRVTTSQWKSVELVHQFLAGKVNDLHLVLLLSRFFFHYCPSFVRDSLLVIWQNWTHDLLSILYWCSSRTDCKASSLYFRKPCLLWLTSCEHLLPSFFLLSFCLSFPGQTTRQMTVISSDFSVLDASPVLLSRISPNETTRLLLVVKEEEDRQSVSE